MWDLSSPTRDQTRTPCIGRRSLNHWIAREVPAFAILELITKDPFLQKDRQIRGTNSVSGIVSKGVTAIAFDPQTTL